MSGLIVSMPFIASGLVSFYGYAFGRQGSNFLIVTTLSMCTCLAISFYYEIIMAGVITVLPIYELIPELAIDMTLMYDAISISFVCVVLMISTMVHFFAVYYMSNDTSSQRFMATLCAFTASMLLLVIGDGIALMFVGWELIGITSFMCIGYWWSSSNACNAAAHAIIINRIGDWSLTLALVALPVFGYHALYNNVYLTELAKYMLLPSIMDADITIWIPTLLVIGACAKSAQFILHTWLPTSMAGPTPVSALLHAATLVAAGTYVLLRYQFLIEISTTALLLCAGIGSITAVFAATSALFQYDIKRIIAYSTCSQFGYITASVGMHEHSMTLYHLSSHSAFKSLMFITAGVAIHSMHDNQDLRRYGALMLSLPFTYICTLIASMSLIAMPYMSGHHTKDALLENSLIQYTIPSISYWGLGCIVAGITAMYTTSMIVHVYGLVPNGSRQQYENLHQLPIVLIIPMTILSILSVGFGYIASDTFMGIGTDTFEFTLLTSMTMHSEYGLSIIYKIMPLIATISGIIIGLSLRHITAISKGAILSIALSGRWHVDAAYARGLTWPSLQLASNASLHIDLGLIELLGPSGLHALTLEVSSFSLISTIKSARGVSQKLNEHGMYYILFIALISMQTYVNIVTVLVLLILMNF